MLTIRTILMFPEIIKKSKESVAFIELCYLKILYTGDTESLDMCTVQIVAPIPKIPCLT